MALRASRTIVITGCSSGLGRATALHLARRGWLVFATVRREADAASLSVEAMSLEVSDNIRPVRILLRRLLPDEWWDAQVCKALGW